MDHIKALIFQTHQLGLNILVHTTEYANMAKVNMMKIYTAALSERILIAKVKLKARITCKIL